MARIEIDTGVATTTTVKAAFDSINTMTAELYGGAYTGHNAVQFDGSSDYLVNEDEFTDSTGNPFEGGTFEYFSGAFILTPTSFTTAQELLWASTTCRFRIDPTTGRVSSNLIGIGGANANGTAESALTLGQRNVIQFATRCHLTEVIYSQFSLWVNGVLALTAKPATPGGYTFGTYADWGLFAAFSGATKYTGGVELVWLTAGNDQSHYILPGKYDFRNTRSLGVNGEAPGVVPQVYLGGPMVAADWNASSANAGGGVGFTMKGDGVA